MYAIKKSGEILYIVEDLPTQEIIEEMGGDDFSEYVEPKRIYTKKDIGDKIVREAFDGNPHAQLADLVGAVLGIAYLLAQSHGKENVKAVLTPLLGSLEAASDVREKEGLSRFDVSFLD